MAIARDDRWLADAQGRALAGALVYWCLQPATVTDTPPPSPLAVIYSDLSGTPLVQPVLTDGFGHAVAYMDDNPLYTLVFYHPLFGANPVILPDQHIGAGTGGTSYIPFEGIPAGTIDGVNTVFTLTNAGTPLVPGTPVAQAEVCLNMPLIPGVGYTLSGVTVTYANPPQPASGSIPGDSIYARGWISS